MTKKSIVFFVLYCLCLKHSFSQENQGIAKNVVYCSTPSSNTPATIDELNGELVTEDDIPEIEEGHVLSEKIAVKRPEISSKIAERERHLFYIEFFIVIPNKAHLYPVATNIELQESLNYANDAFLNSDIGFLPKKRENYKEITYNKDKFLKDDMYKLIGEYKTPKYISVFIVPQIEVYAVGLNESTLGLAFEVENVIFLSYEGAISDMTTLTHELGHIFGLKHTHNVDEEMPREYVARFECLRRGDGICDTPADPGMSLTDREECGKTCFYSCSSKHRDPFGYSYLPLVDNYMSYYPSDCKSSFTHGQFTVMRINMIRKKIKELKYDIDDSKPPIYTSTSLSEANYHTTLSSPKKAIVFIVDNKNIWASRQLHEFKNSNLFKKYRDKYYHLVILNIEEEKSHGKLKDFINTDNFISDTDFDNSPALYNPINIVYRHLSEMMYGIKIKAEQEETLLLRDCSYRVVPTPSFFIVDFKKMSDNSSNRLLHFQEGYTKPLELREILEKFK